MPRRYPAEFRRKVLDLVAAGRPVAQIAHDLQISAQTICTWRRQQLIDSGQLPGMTSTDHAELVAARKRIAELENELAIHGRGAPKGGFEAVAVMAADGLPVQLATRVLGVSESGYYEWRDRAPSARAVRHAWLTEQIQAVHLASRGTYGSRRVHAKYRNLAEPGPERQNGRVYSADFFEDRWRRYPHQSLSGGPLDGGGGSGHLGRSSPGRGVSRADQADRCARGGTPGAGPRGRVAHA